MKRLVLLGDGPAHRQVLAELARERMAAAQVLWVADRARVFDPRVLVGFVSGRQRAEAGWINLPPLAAAAEVRFVEAAVTAVDAAQRRVVLADGRVAEYEMLSIDDEGGPDRDALPGAREQGLFLHPVSNFVRLFDGLLDLAARRELDVVVIGAGQDAVALALALQQRLARDEERARIVLVTGGPEPLAGLPEARQRRAARQLARARVTVVREACTRIEARCVHLGNGARLACDAPLLASAPQPPRWLAGSGLALDAQGRPASGPTLQSLSHPEVFVGAAGAGVLLAHNLRRHAGGGELRLQRSVPRWRQALGALTGRASGAR